MSAESEPSEEFEDPADVERVLRICDLYYKQCRAMVARRIGTTLQGRTSATSIVESAVASLAIDAQKGRLEIRTHEDVVKALHRKVSDKVVAARRRHFAERRSLNSEAGGVEPHYASNQPTPDEIAIANELAERCLKRIEADEHEQRLVATLLWLMFHYSPTEIHQILVAAYGDQAPSRSAVNVWIQRARMILREELGDDLAA